MEKTNKNNYLKKMKNEKQKHIPRWKKDWYNMSGGICAIFGFITLIMIFTDYINNTSSCNSTYGLGAGIAFILFAVAFMFYNKNGKNR